MEKIIIIGTSTNARHAFDFINCYHLYDIVGFAVDKSYKECDEFMGLPVYEIEKLKSVIGNERIKLFVAVFWNRLNADRRDLYTRLKLQGFEFANLISPHSIIHGELLGDNIWIHDNVIINSFAKIGNNVMIMANAFIGMDSVIEDHCFCGARCLVASCVIGEQTFLGISSTIFDEVKIGKKCLVGATCAVKRNLPDYSLIKTSNDAQIVKQYNENTIEEKLLFKRIIR